MKPRNKKAEARLRFGDATAARPQENAMYQANRNKSQLVSWPERDLYPEKPRDAK